MTSEAAHADLQTYICKDSVHVSRSLAHSREKNEAFECYKRSSELSAPVGTPCGKPNRAGRLTSNGVNTHPIYLASYAFVAAPWTLSTDAYHRVKSPSANAAHTIMNSKNAGLVRIAFVGPFVYQCIQQSLHAKQSDCIAVHSLRSPGNRSSFPAGRAF